MKVAEFTCSNQEAGLPRGQLAVGGFLYRLAAVRCFIWLSLGWPARAVRIRVTLTEANGYLPRIYQ